MLEYRAFISISYIRLRCKMCKSDYFLRFAKIKSTQMDSELSACNYQSKSMLRFHRRNGVKGMRLDERNQDRRLDKKYKWNPIKFNLMSLIILYNHSIVQVKLLFLAYNGKSNTSLLYNVCHSFGCAIDWKELCIFVWYYAYVIHKTMICCWCRRRRRWFSCVVYITIIFFIVCTFRLSIWCVGGGALARAWLM